MTAKDYFRDTGTLTDKQLLAIDFCMAFIVVLTIVIVIAMVV